MSCYKLPLGSSRSLWNLVKVSLFKSQEQPFSIFYMAYLLWPTCHKYSLSSDVIIKTQTDTPLINTGIWKSLPRKKYPFILLNRWLH